MTNETLATVATAKVHKGAAVKAASAELAVGTHDVDVLVRITGSLTRGEDFDQRIVGKADAWALAAALLARLGPVDVAAVVRDSLSGALKGAVDSLKAEAAAAMLVLKGATLTRCNGKVTTKLSAEVVEAEAVPA
jgi:hypothetical protein